MMPQKHLMHVVLWGITVTVKDLPVWIVAFILCSRFSHAENSDMQQLLLCLTARRSILRLCRCHTIHHCHCDWEEDNTSLSVVLWHSLCDFIASVLAPEFASGEPSWGTAIASSLQLYGYDGIYWYCLCSPRTPLYTTVLSPTPTSAHQWKCCPGLEKMEAWHPEPTHSVWNIVFTFKRCQFTA